METYRYPTHFGDALIAVVDNKLVSLKLESPVQDSPVSNSDSPVSDSSSTMQLVCRWLDLYFSGQVPDFIPPYSLNTVTPFGRKVLEAVLDIPFGQTATYGDIAKAIGCRSAQAVGQALKRNPIWLIIPCHRITAANGCGGYAGGLQLKQALLVHENIC